MRRVLLVNVLAAVALSVGMAAARAEDDAPKCDGKVTDITDVKTRADLDGAVYEAVGKADTVRVTTSVKVSRGRFTATDRYGARHIGVVECTMTCTGSACSGWGCDAWAGGCSSYSCDGDGCTGSCTKKTTAGGVR